MRSAAPVFEPPVLTPEGHFPVRISSSSATASNSPSGCQAMWLAPGLWSPEQCLAGHRIDDSAVRIGEGDARQAGVDGDPSHGGGQRDEPCESVLLQVVDSQGGTVGGEQLPAVRGEVERLAPFVEEQGGLRTVQPPDLDA